MPDPRLPSIFASALDQPDPAARAAYLDEACAGDPALRAELEAILAAHEGAGRFLRLGDKTSVRPPTAPMGTTLTNAPDCPTLAPEAAPSATDGLTVAPGPVASDAATATGPEKRSTADHRTLPSDGPRVVERRADPLIGQTIAGKYTLVEELGKGGMGAVYRAEQTHPVKRQVALKLIQAGMDSQGVQARFDAERQALALMDHPNIARVFDGGTTTNGQPFFVMELVRGTPITTYCDRARLTIRERLDLFKLVCAGVQHAHQKGIIHRDLKPGNVLVTEVDGRPTPKVIDFGVAKATEQRLTEMSLAETGAIVGTVYYMSPEQAAASPDIDTRTDVYALGVILYELLVGSRPIDKHGLVYEVLRIVREVDPPSPSIRLGASDVLPGIAEKRQADPVGLKRAIRGDLDWIVMKALEKERTRRYDSPNEFADDVQRHLAFELVKAAPPSRAYRARKFLRKNRVMAGAVSAVVLALVCGVAGTWWGLEEARREAKNAYDREQDAIRARQKLENANDEVRQQKDRLVDTIARSALNPLAVQLRGDEFMPPLNDQEIGAMWELATVPDEAVRMRFVELVLSDDDSTRRFSLRAPVALHASVGLDSERCKAVEERLARRIQELDRQPTERQQIAMFLAYLGNTKTKSIDNINTNNFSKQNEALSQLADAERLVWFVRGISPNDAAPILAAAMTKTTYSYALRELAKGLSSVAARMPLNEAVPILTTAANTLTGAMAETASSLPLGILAEGLSSVAAKMPPKDAGPILTTAAHTLTAAMTGTTGSKSLMELAAGLSSVAARMPAKDATPLLITAANTLTAAMAKTDDSDTPKGLIESLLLVAAQMRPNDAAPILATAANSLTAVMTKTTRSNALDDLAKGLSLLAAWMPANDGATMLTAAMTKTTNSTALGALAKGLSSVAARMPSNEAVLVLRTAANTLTAEMAIDTLSSALIELAGGLSSLATRMPPNDAATMLTAAMAETSDSYALGTLALGLSSVVDRMPHHQAAPILTTAANTLTAAMTRTTGSKALKTLAAGLSSVIARMSSKDTTPILTTAVHTLTAAMAKTSDKFALVALAEGLASVVDRMPHNQAAPILTTAANTLTAAMAKTDDSYPCLRLAAALSSVTAKMPPNEAAPILTTAANTLTAAMAKTNLVSGLLSLAAGLSLVADGMSPNDAAAMLTAAMTKTTNSTALEELAKGLSSVAARMPPNDAAPVLSTAAKTLTAEMAKHTGSSDMMELAAGLSSLTTRMRPNDAAPILTTAIAQTTHSYALMELAAGISLVAATMPPNDATRLLNTAAKSLTAAMAKSTDPLELRRLAGVLSSVAAKMPPNDAAAILTAAMAKTTDSEALNTFAKNLSTALHQFSPASRARSVIAMTGALAIPGPPVEAVLWAKDAAQPIPSPLPAQALVDILKTPFCVGQARRIVLDELERHYNRKFDDQWDFVDYVRAQELPLDLTSPPARPRP